MITSDCHMHTSFSTDSSTAPEAMVEGALEKGLKAICITDHMDWDYPFSEELGKDAFLFDVDVYFQKLTKLREQYAGQIELRIGIELGLQPHAGAFCREITEKYPFDFVIGSVHVVDKKDPYYRERFSELTDRELYRLAFEETLESIRHTDTFDVLGHMDYIVRYGTYKTKDYSYAAFAPWLDEVLKQIIEMGKGIELNSAGLKYGLGFCHPHPDVLRRYRELGGEIITVGADGHQPEHIAYEFGRAAEVLRECGFEYYTEFLERKPVFRKL